MTQTHTPHSALDFLGGRRIGPMSELALRAVVVLATWEERRRSRKHLSKLPPHLLRDIGIDEMRAAREAERPFWQG
ncbi:DUF1127 domain-containing protein [Anianabacter salinae]|uniref:DUF1127 domain-containing protein n=1 Tax=Anianabacter salinae TaxID=2851023 RepID=UPI00225E08C2|nr:DUF1127 domain-containing protein [Anianabacter salinae]MBV0912262.1 DUF1127 domain-containing protein [Anianabacter salinae]